jgi:protein-tyrosine-phosphatase/DNA-binding transcriptional ArsR family regulator
MEIDDAAQTFAALSQETRLALLRLLLGAGPSGLAAGDIAEGLRLPASTTSFHLAALERAGLVQSTRQSRRIIYAVRIAALRSLVVFLTEACCAGHPELCGDLGRLLPEEARPVAPAFNVLFLCTRNSARSIMAEALLRDLGRGRFRAFSAGSEPDAAPMPDVLQKLHALGHDVAELRCKSWDAFAGADAPRMDFVIALCDVLHGQLCPEFGEAALTAAWPLPDPAKFHGNTAERATMLNELYGSLRRRIGIFVSLPFASLDRMALKARLDEIGVGPVAALARGR